MKKKKHLLGVAVLVAALLALSGAAQSAMWVGAELGGNFPMPSVTEVGGTQLGGLSFDSTVIGGAMIGYDFVNSGFGAHAWPDWMKYFSVATDITYNALRVHGLGGDRLPYHVNGYCVAWSFLLMAHYGFLPDSEVPSGRINPYLGVGPSIIWTGLTNQNIYGNSTNIGLVVEPGIRWMALRNVSVDTSFRMRMTAPSYTFFNVDRSLNSFFQLSFLLRANYHF